MGEEFDFARKYRKELILAAIILNNNTIQNTNSVRDTKLFEVNDV